MLRTFRESLIFLLATSLVLGIGYPLATTLASQLLFPFQANGSLLEEAGEVKGSLLIGQSFTSPGMFHGRPSATGGQPYNPLASGGSNLGPSNPARSDAAQARIAVLCSLNACQAGRHPPRDLWEASASGLDPHVSLAGARFQVARVARELGVDSVRVRAWVDSLAESVDGGIFGEARVNVLKLNHRLALP